MNVYKEIESSLSYQISRSWKNVLYLPWCLGKKERNYQIWSDCITWSKKQKLIFSRKYVRMRVCVCVYYLYVCNSVCVNIYSY